MKAHWVAASAMVVSVLSLQAPARAATVPCDQTIYPTPAWITCESGNTFISRQNALGHLNLIPGVASESSKYQQARLAAVVRDPERQPNPNACTAIVACPMDPRLSVAKWKNAGGLVQTVLYTSRSGATMSGRVWATRDGAKERPGVVVINGSIIGFEETYWFVAQTLARAGFVVMTFDVQGEGMSDQFGEAPDQNEDSFAGIAILGLLAPKGATPGVFGGNGLPFYDGGQDALDFFLSTPTDPYVPRPSRTTQTPHAAKQARRVEAGLNNAYNPLWNLLDQSKIGLTGHSYGAEAASWLAQEDPRADAAVALDSLCVPRTDAADEATNLGASNPDFGGAPNIMYGLSRDCFGTPPGQAPPITKPALGIAGDYLLAPTPYLRPPNPLGKSRASLEYSKAGVDTGQIIIRGGTHVEFMDFPVGAPASARGIDMVAWYTTAWFSKYLQDSGDGDRMLLTRRWQDDATTGRVDQARDANMFSWHFSSRLDITLSDGATFRCENIRAGCEGMNSASSDGWPGSYDFVTAATTAN